MANEKENNNRLIGTKSQIIIRCIPRLKRFCYSKTYIDTADRFQNLELSFQHRRNLQNVETHSINGRQ